MSHLKERALNQIPAEIDKDLAREIAAFMRRTGWDWWGVFFNNFLGHLPGGFYRRTDYGDALYRNEGASRKRRELTKAQFHALVDRMIDELGLNAEQIQSLVLSHDVDQLYIYVQPLFLRLRLEGFKRYPDLTA